MTDNALLFLPTAAQADHPGPDREALLDSVDSDPDLLRTVIQIFLTHYPELLAQLDRSVREADNKAIARGAHSFKGSSLFLNKRANELVGRLERAGLDHDLIAAKETLGQLSREVIQLVPHLANMQI